MKIGAKITIFIILLLTITISSIIVSLNFELQTILLEFKNREISSDLKKTRSDLRYLIDQYQKYFHYILSDYNLSELLTVYKFTRKTDAIRSKLNIQKEIAGCDEIELYDKAGNLIITTEGATEKRLSMPGKIGKGEIACKIITEDDLLKVVYYGRIFKNDSLIGAIILKKQIDNSFLKFLTGRRDIIIAILEKEEDGLKVRATTYHNADEFKKMLGMSIPDNSACTSNDFVMGNQHGVLSIVPLKTGINDKDLLLLYFVDKKDIEQIHKQIILISFILGSFFALLGCIAAVMFFKRKTNVLKRLSDYSGRIAGGDFSHRMDFKSGDEIEDLCEAFNNMSEELSRAMQQEKELAAAQAAAAVEKKKGKEIETARGQLDSTLQSIGDGVITTDMHGRIVMMNSMAEGLTGWNYTDAEERFIEEVYKTINEKTRNPVKNPVDMALRDGKVVGLANNTLLIRKDGKELPISNNGAPIVASNGDIIGVVLVFQDRTKRREAEKELEKARTEAESANTAKSEFLANMSHEIRTPMNAVLGFTDMLLDTDLTNDQHDYANTVKRSGESLLFLINDILDFSKIEARQLDFEEIAFDPELLAYDVCEMVQPKIRSKSIEILCRIGDNVPSMVKGDPTRFRQVLNNLMGNAPKFTESGEIELSLNVEEENKDGIKLHAKIKDTGIGIPKDKLSTIFEPFKQADGSTTRKYGGTGLGLAICRQIAELMRGDVRAENRADKGSVFHFTAWLKKAEPEKHRKFGAVSLSNRKVLIVDDNLNNLEILVHNLESAGMHTVALTNGKDVYPTLQKALAGQHPFDLCICDIQMPGMSGYDVARKINDSKSGIQGLPLIALSSLMERDARKCEDAGFDGFLSKPVRREKLFQMMERLLGEEIETERHFDAPAAGQFAAQNPIITQYSLKEEIKHSVQILLAEDHPVNRKLAKIMLTKAGYQVEVAENGKEAVEKYMQSPDRFDLIFMDIQMPEMDGLKATKEIRKQETGSPADQSAKHLPIIAMTAHAMKGDREICLEAGMDDYLSKPIKRELVFEMLERWVFQGQAAQGAGEQVSWGVGELVSWWERCRGESCIRPTCEQVRKRVRLYFRNVEKRNISRRAHRDRRGKIICFSLCSPCTL